jgi:hypothetical protein
MKFVKIKKKYKNPYMVWKLIYLIFPRTCNYCNSIVWFDWCHRQLRVPFNRCLKSYKYKCVDCYKKGIIEKEVTYCVI